MKNKEKSLILYSLLDRIPILVFGDKSLIINDFLIELCNMIIFRKELVYYTDFVSNVELLNLINNEFNDYNSERVQIRCPTNVSMKAISELENLKSLVLGIELKTDYDIVQVENIMKKKSKEFLEIIFKQDNIIVRLIGIDETMIDLSIENKIFQKVTEDTEKAIIKMKRVLSENIKRETFNDDLFKSLLDFEIEKKEIKTNIFQKEIQEFYSGAKRAFFILSKLNFLNNMLMDSTIGTKTLLETIDYEVANIERILSFIENEWYEDFSNLIENSKFTFISDKIQSFWG